MNNVHEGLPTFKIWNIFHQNGPYRKFSFDIETTSFEGQVNNKGCNG